MGDVINLADRRQEKAEQKNRKSPEDTDSQERVERIKTSIARINALIVELRFK
jgi:hypothetical protein